MTITLETIAILLSIVSFVVTVFGFFASLKFYRDGVNLQRTANDLLTKVAEKTETIQSQVGGMFDKTLDAALGKREALNNNFEELETQLSNAKEALLVEMRGQIGQLGEQQQIRIKNTVEEQIRILKEKVESTRESAEEITSKHLAPTRHMPILQYNILAALLHGGPLSEAQLGEQLGYPEASTKIAEFSRRLSWLLNLGYIQSNADTGILKFELTESGIRTLV